MIIEQMDHPYRENRFEIVEKKGLGHPDTLCDGISDAISRGLSKYYRDHFGVILHHNVDKVLIVAGEAVPEFGGGRILKPMSIIIGGRATDQFEGTRIPVSDIAHDCTEKYLRSNIKNLGDNFHIEPRLGVGSAELRSLVERAGANDTSIGVGYAPFSRLEDDVTATERIVREVQGVGEDVKVMGIRHDGRIDLTISAAIISKYVKDMDAYSDIKVVIASRVLEAVSPQWEDALVSVNAADSGNNIYLTITGTSAEMGDDGETGRGNRANGLITPGRPMTLEAHAGKNPVNHVGKIYNILAKRAAEDIAKIDGIEDAYVYLVSKIGSPMDKPQIKAARIYGSAPYNKIEYAIDYWLERIPCITDDFLEERC